MARLKADLKTLATRERELRDELKRIRQQRRAADEAARQARLARVGELAEQFNITCLSPTVLAAEFKLIATKHPTPATAESSANDATVTAEPGEDTQTPAGAATQASPESADRAAETAEGGDSERKKWSWK